MNLYLKQEPCIGMPVFHKLYKKMFAHVHNADQCVSWALMREYGEGEADLMMIYTDEPGNGYGIELLERIKQLYTTIYTSWSGSTKEGRALCLKAGFVREDDLIIWRKEKENAVQIKEPA